MEVKGGLGSSSASASGGGAGSRPKSGLARSITFGTAPIITTTHNTLVGSVGPGHSDNLDRVPVTTTTRNKLMGSVGSVGQTSRPVVRLPKVPAMASVSKVPMAASQVPIEKLQAPMVASQVPMASPVPMSVPQVPKAASQVSRTTLQHIPQSPRLNTSIGSAQAVLAVPAETVPMVPARNIDMPETPTRALHGRHLDPETWPALPSQRQVVMPAAPKSTGVPDRPVIGPPRGARSEQQNAWRGPWRSTS